MKRLVHDRIVSLIGTKATTAVLQAAPLERLGMPALAALVYVESGGRHIYGGSDGQSACLSGFPFEVNESNFLAFLWEVKHARASTNGVGLVQLTYVPYFDQMMGEDLKPWDPVDNARFGARLMRANRARYGSLREAYARYNGGPNPPPVSYQRAERYVSVVQAIREVPQ